MIMCCLHDLIIFQIRHNAHSKIHSFPIDITEYTSLWYTLCCISLRRFFFWLKTRVIIKIESHPWYLIIWIGMRQKIESWWIQKVTFFESTNFQFFVDKYCYYNINLIDDKISFLDAEFIQTGGFMWRTATITAISCVPLYIWKFCARGSRQRHIRN